MSGCTAGAPLRCRAANGCSNSLTDFKRKNTSLMPMKIKLSTILLGGAAFAAVGAGFALAQAVDPRLESYDKGPATINAPKYPPLTPPTSPALPHNTPQLHTL